MPELPEVETVRTGLQPALQGRRILKATLNRPNLRFPFPERMAERLAGRVVERIDRRAKYLLLRLSGDETLLVHLGMSGRFRSRPRPGRPSRAISSMRRPPIRNMTMSCWRSKAG